MITNLKLVTGPPDNEHRWLLCDTTLTDVSAAGFVYSTSRATYGFTGAGGMKRADNGVEIPAHPLMLMTGLVYGDGGLKDMPQEFITTVCHALHNLEIDDVVRKLGGEFNKAPLYDLSFRTAATLATPTCECKLCQAVREIKSKQPPHLIGPVGQCPLTATLNGCLITTMHALIWDMPYGTLCNAIYTQWATRTGKMPPMPPEQGTPPGTL